MKTDQTPNKDPRMDATRDLTWTEAREAIRPLLRTDNRTNIRYLVREYALLALALMGCILAHRAWVAGRIDLAAFAPIAFLGVLLIGAIQHRLSGLAHDAAHGTLFRNRLANELASDLFLMFPIVAFTQKYRMAHLGHHRYVNDPARDPDWIRLDAYEPMAFPMDRARFLRRYVLRALWPPTILRYLFGRAVAANTNGGGAGGGSATIRAVYRFRVARCLRGTYWLTLLTTVHALDAWVYLGLFWIVPLLTAYPFLMLLREIAHHANAPDAGDLTNSRIFRVHPILEFAVFPYGQAFHLTHHLVAMVPHYRIREADAILRHYPPYRDQVVVCRGYFVRRSEGAHRGPSVLDIFARKLSSRAATPGRIDPAHTLGTSPTRPQDAFPARHRDSMHPLR